MALSEIKAVWSAVFLIPIRALDLASLLLLHPLEVVAAACESQPWQGDLLRVFARVFPRSELTPSSLLEKVKFIKLPDWRYRSEEKCVLRDLLAGRSVNEVCALLPKDARAVACRAQ